MNFLKKGVLNLNHVVSSSPWPILGSLGGFLFVSSLMNWIYFKTLNYFFGGVLIMSFIMLGWWLKIIEEGLEGAHKKMVQNYLSHAMLLFILSEIMFFFSFFWCFFHNCWGVNEEGGFLFPPFGLNPILIDPFSVPLLKSIILLSSGIFVTWSHNEMMVGGVNVSSSLCITMLLGMLFLLKQSLEYTNCSLSFNSLSYGSCFYILTGFHGFHVLVGTIFLFMCLVRSLSSHFSSEHHLGFEFSMWYWHFVDVVWLFLYISVYWYGYIT